MKTKAEPRFDIDVKWGRQGELQFEEFLKWIAEGNGRVEVKTKRYLDLKIYIETHHDPGRRGHYRPSGISVSTALMYAVLISDTGIHLGIPVDMLKDALDDASTVDASEDDGSCPTRGKLIDFSVLVLRLKQQREGNDRRRPNTKATSELPAAKVATAAHTCIHKPEHMVDGKCFICEHTSNDRRRHG